MDLESGLATTDAEKLKLLLHVSRLVAGRLEMKALIAEVVRQASRLVSADRSTLWLYDADRHDIYTFLGEGLRQEVRLPVGRGVAGTAAKERRTIVTNDAYNSPYFDPETDRRSGYLTKSLLAVPMETYDGRLLGCFQSINRLDENAPGRLGEFTDADVELLSALAAVAAVAVENSQLYEEQRRQFNSFIVTLAQTVDARDATTSNHTMMVTGIAVAVARQLGLSDSTVERIRIAAVLHDYGKIGVPDSVLLKPSGHDADERRQMKSHVLKTILVLRKIAFRRDLADIPLIAGMHHEKLDGTGYPFGLQGEEIPLEGRILSVADVFQALIQTRTYKKGLPPLDALAKCREMTRPHTDHHRLASGAHLDSNVVDALGRVLELCHGDLSFFERASGWDRMLGNTGA
jgi:putative nucleotidyltransferase with HDIG domain